MMFMWLFYGFDLKICHRQTGKLVSSFVSTSYQGTARLFRMISQNVNLLGLLTVSSLDPQALVSSPTFVRHDFQGLSRNLCGKIVAAATIRDRFHPIPSVFPDWNGWMVPAFLQDFRRICKQMHQHIGISHSVSLGCDSTVYFFFVVAGSYLFL